MGTPDGQTSRWRHKLTSRRRPPSAPDGPLDPGDEPGAPDGGGAWARLDGRGRGARSKAIKPAKAPRGRARPGPAAADAAADPDLATRRRPPGPFAAEPAGGDRRRWRVAIGIGLGAAAVALLVVGTLRLAGQDPEPPAPAPVPPLASFDLPRTWVDRTAELAGRVEGVRPSFVFQGPVTDGFAADVNVVRQPRGPGDPPLDRLVDLVAGQVSAQLGATRVGGVRRLTLGGEPALVYEYRYQAHGLRLRARQIAAIRGASVVFVNFTAHERAFARDVRALDQLAASWRWR